MLSKFVGGMLGTALGDAIGELAFSVPGEAELRSKITEAGRLIYTDDTAMAIGLAESLLEVGQLDPQKLGDTWRANYQQEPWRGYAIGPPTIFSLYAFVRYPHSFESCLLCATLNGGDRDTLGAMACAVSGAYLGDEGIPRSWRDKLENRQYIERLARDLAERTARDRASP